MYNKNVDQSSIIGLFLILFVITFFTYFFDNEHKKNDFIKEKLQYKNFSLIKKDQIKNNEDYTFLENKVLKIKISNKGGEINNVFLKKYKAYNPTFSNHSKNLHLINDSSLSYKILFPNKKGFYNIHSTNLIFRPFIFSSKENKILIMKAENPNVKNQDFLEYVYILGNKNQYHIDFFIRTKNFPLKKGLPFELEQKIFSFEKDRNWENSYTKSYYSIYNNNNSEITSVKSFSEKNTEEKRISDLNWIAHKQQFFTSIFIPEKPLKDIFVYSENFTYGKCLKKIGWKTFLNIDKDKKKDENFNFSFRFYFGPLDFNLLKEYKNNYENIIPFGWGFLKWINKYFFLVIFQFLEKTNLNYGIIIILMTIVVKLILSPITYRQYKLSAIMKLIHPEIEELNKKYKNEDTLKKQRAIMELYQKAGINPMSGCISTLFQIPIFYSLFKFFPTIINLRGKSFLWVDDLTSYDSILELPFSIPFYGSHVSLLTLLYSLALLAYTKLSNDGRKNNIQQNDNENVISDMNFILYLMPVIMLLFINSYASALSLYYFISNIINIGLMFFIKKIMLNNKKIFIKIRKENRKHISWKKLIKQLLDKNKNNITG
ncbi:YidC/Oxa1 family insertase periplasmic-domain containing protein [Blattabacterium cuenoti]|uniref:YidC/Oxa1 family insertase periplasmic-domain containing protein n=1 Tax=Blattabacterium cuenoti TaxID=1653831 RepID=UPI00163C2C4D|nr:YidC/Oxa1 family insertase periplasmic-domain containing protein [Blattabacterium cuenoti]